MFYVFFLIEKLQCMYLSPCEQFGNVHVNTVEI